MHGAIAPTAWLLGGRWGRHAALPQLHGRGLANMRPVMVVTTAGTHALLHTSKMLWLYMGVGPPSASPCPALRKLLRVGPSRSGFKAPAGQLGTSRSRTGGALQVSRAHGRRGSFAHVVHSAESTYGTDDRP